jgi:hypothetical protein
MARRMKAEGRPYIEADNGFGWVRDRASVASVASGKYRASIFGIRYELEKRRRNVADETYDTGWYLYSFGVPSGFFGEWCAPTLLPAIDEASKMIAKADLRGEGYEKENSE